MAESVYALEAELHEPRPGDRSRVVRRDLEEAERLVERKGFLHRRQGVQPHARIADRPRLADHGLGQAAPQSRAAGRMEGPSISQNPPWGARGATQRPGSAPAASNNRPAGGE